MLGVSLRVPEPIDLAVPINKYIQANYSQDEYTQVQRSVADIQQLRKTVTQALSRQDQNYDSTVELLQQYYATLCTLKLHFNFGIDALTNVQPLQAKPAAAAAASAEKSSSSFFSKLRLSDSSSQRDAVKSPTPGSPSPATSKFRVNSVRVPFVWHDAFRYTNKVNDYDLAFEQASILFDVGSTYSRHATHTKANNVDDAGTKDALRLFQNAAGVYDYMSKSMDVLSCSRLTSDFSAECLQMLTKLMLAQAQACFFEKACATASPKLVAKIAAGVAELFRNAYDICSKSHLKQLFTGSKDVYNWEAHTYYQLMCYSATANYWHAKALFGEDEYGAEIAHLERSRLYLQNAKKVESALVPNLAQNRERLETNINNRLKSAVRDNETIYYSPVPPANSIKDPESVISVKATPYEPTKELKVDPFTTLVTPAIREAANTFQNRLLTLVQTNTQQAQQSSDAAKQRLSALGLPGSLDALETTSGISDDLWQSVHDIQLKGGVNTLEEMQGSLQSAVADCNRVFTTTKETLSKEASEDHAMRQQFHHRWNRRPSEQLTVSVWKEAEAIDNFLQQSTASDNRLSAEYANNKEKLTILSQSRDELERKLPQASVNLTEQTTQSSQQLRQLYDQLQALLTERDQQLAAIADLPQRTDITNALLHRSSNTPVETIYDEEISKIITPRAEELNKIQERQTELLQQISAANETFNASRKANETLVAKQAVMQHISTAAQTYNKLLAHYNEGQRFYADLMNTKIRPLKQRVDDYMVARSMEQRMILDQLTRETVGYTEPQDGQKGANDFTYPATNPNLSLDAPSSSGNYASLSSGAQMPSSAPANHAAGNNGYGNSRPTTPTSQQRPAMPSSQPPSHQPQGSPTNSMPYQYSPPSHQHNQQQQQQHPQSYMPTAYPPANQQYQQPPAYNSRPAQQQPPQQQSNDVACPACTYLNGKLDDKCVLCNTPLR